MTVNITDNSANVLRELDNKVNLILSTLGETAEGYAKVDCP